MNRRLLNFVWIIAILLVITATSCLNDKEDYTPEREREMFNDYVARLRAGGHTVLNTPSGIHYVNIEQGSGAFPVSGDTLSVQYAGYLVTGQLFDASIYHSADSTLHFVYKNPEMIKGWDEMMGMMNKGKKVEFIIPSELAYGSTRYGSIPPYSSLIFVAKMMNIRPKTNP